MDIDQLVKMANQVGRFFEAWSDRDEARREVAAHLTRFWEPRMRRALVEHVAAGVRPAGLTPLVAEAIATMPADRGPPSSP